jgi:hypothetical protein
MNNIDFRMHGARIKIILYVFHFSIKLYERVEERGYLSAVHGILW